MGTYNQYFHMLQQDEPLLALNVILGVFTVISFAKLFVDICTTKSKQSQSSELHDYMREIRQDLEDLRGLITDLQSGSQASSDSDCSEELQEQEQLQLQLQLHTTALASAPAAPEAEAPEAAAAAAAAQAVAAKQKKVLVINEIKPVPLKQEDKHKQLISRLKNNEELSMTYKKQTFTATFIVKSDSQHGYVLKSGATEYNTPSDFSRAKKISINDKIKSDNGWDTVTVHRDGNKLTLNELIGQEA